MRDLLDDLRLGLRGLRRSPGFTAAAVLCLALGIGANAAVFSFANAVFLQDRGVADPERLVWVIVEWKEGLKYGAWSYPDVLDLGRRREVFTGLAAETLQPVHLAADGRGERLWGSLVSAGYFSVLGVDLPLGRGFGPEEGVAPGEDPVLVVSHGLWHRRFGAAPDVVGRTVTLNGHPFTVVGVAPEGFSGPNAGVAPELWLPLRAQGLIGPGGSRLEARGDHWIAFAVARLAPGVTSGQAQAAVDALMTHLAEIHPESNTGKTARVYGAAEAGLHPLVRGSFVTFLGLLFGVVGLVLLLACANVAGLLVARAAARRREIAVRLALGASRWRLLRPLASESALLALAAGAAGLTVAAALTRLPGAVLPAIDLPLDFSAPRLDAAVLGFTLLVALATAVLFGLTPALGATKPGPGGVLAAGAAGGPGRASRLRRGLVVGQVALSAVLLVGAALVLESLANARTMDLGFEPDGQLVASVDAGLAGYAGERADDLFRTLEERIAALPGVEAVGYARRIPLSLFNFQTPALLEGHAVPAGAGAPTVDYNAVGPGYFAAMGIGLLRGRPFAAGDGEDGPPALVINRAFARRYWPGEEPLGKRVRVRGADHTVVGMVADGKYWSLGEEPRPYLYLPIDRHPQTDRTLHVRVAGDPAGLLEAVRREVRELDPTLPLYTLETMRSHLSFAMLPMHLASWVVGSFAALALLLAAVGLYGVIAYWVGRRTREIGVRMALGARAGDVARMVVGRGMALTLVGLAAGLGAGLAGARLVAGFLYGVDPAAPAAYLAAAAVLAAAALAATALPARRAARVDPARALRAE